MCTLFALVVQSLMLRTVFPLASDHIDQAGLCSLQTHQVRAPKLDEDCDRLGQGP